MINDTEWNISEMRNFYEIVPKYQAFISKSLPRWQELYTADQKIALRVLWSVRHSLFYLALKINDRNSINSYKQSEKLRIYSCLLTWNWNISVCEI